MEGVAIMKKVAVVINSAWQGYNFRLNLARAFKNNDYKVIFIAPDDRKYSKKIKQEFEFIHIPFNAGGISPIQDLKVCYLLHKIYKENRFDIVLNFTIKPNIYSSIVARLLNIKSINNITGLGTVFIEKTFVTNVVMLLYRISLFFSTHVFFQNSEDKDYFLSKGLVTKKKCSLIPGSGVDTKKFTPVCNERKIDTFKFLLVARVIRDKGILEYIDAAYLLKKKYKNIEFGLLGELGSINRTSIPEEKILKLHNNGIINYKGMTDNVIEQLANSNCVVLPSYREGCPRSLMEASSMALPIVATDVVGCRYIIDDGINGLLCHVRDSYDLALKMEKIFNMSIKDRNRMGKFGREKMINEFDESIVIKEYMNFVNKLIN